MTQEHEITFRITKLNRLLADYIPPQDTWSPADKALYKPVDLFRVPCDEALEIQLKAIKHAFTHHYNNNKFYHKYCEEEDIRPGDIKTVDDLDTIPLVPDAVFKQHPLGRNFALWLATVFTGELPSIVIKGANPTFDDVINAFNAAGMVVTYSSGTSGRHTVIPRDMRTYLTQQYAHAKLKSCLCDFMAADHVLMFYPRWTQTNLFIGRDMAHMSDLLNDVRYALDFEISADLALKAMTTKEQERARPSAQERQRKIVENAMMWLERYETSTDVIGLEGGPFLILELIETLEREGKRFEFGERLMIGTAGGWKVSEDKRISAADFRKRVEEVLGIPEINCWDLYGSVEMGGVVSTCPEGHYFHVPYTWFKPLVLDSSFTPVGYGERGRFAFLDGLAGSYPGFIMSGDEVRMLEHCPVCDRPGPVLEPEIRRSKGAEGRGCAEVIRRVLAEEGKKSTR